MSTYDSDPGSRVDVATGYDKEIVGFYDLAHEGAQLRLIASQVAAGEFSSLRGFSPRSIVIVAGDGLSAVVARLAVALRTPLAMPVVISDSLPTYVGALDVVIVVTEKGDDETLSKAVITAGNRGCVVVLCAAAGLLKEDAAKDALVCASLPQVEGPSPMRTVGVILASIDSLSEDPLILAQHLEHMAELIDQELEICSPERDEVVNPARQLAQLDGRIIHTGKNRVGLAVAEAVTYLWATQGRTSTSLSFVELGIAREKFIGNSTDIFYDSFFDEGSNLLPLNIVVWCTPEPGFVGAIAQSTKDPTPLGSPLQLLTRAFAATAFF